VTEQIRAYMIMPRVSSMQFLKSIAFKRYVLL